MPPPPIMSTDTHETRTIAEHQPHTLRAERRRNERLRADFRTNFQIALEFTSEEARYITQPSETVTRNQALKAIFGNKHITIIDAFACVGGDSISFIRTFADGCALHAVQRADNEEEIRRCARLRNNLHNATRGHRTIEYHVYDHPIAETLPNIRRITHGDVDLLFLDPPWFDRGEKLSMENICILLASNVFEPMKQCTLRPAVVCIKLDFNADELNSCETFRRMTQDYTIFRTVDVTRNHTPVYYFHILKHNMETPPRLDCLMNRVGSKLDSILTDLRTKATAVNAPPKRFTRRTAHRTPYTVSGTGMDDGDLQFRMDDVQYMINEWEQVVSQT